MKPPVLRATLDEHVAMFLMNALRGVNTHTTWLTSAI